MEPTQPTPEQTNFRFAGDSEPEAGKRDDERTPSERAELSAGDRADTSRTPGPTLAFVRPVSTESTPTQRRAVWPRRLMLIIFVVFCMEVGIMLAVLPWKQVWTSNPLVLQYPALRAFLGNHFVRGIFSGLGMVDLWIGIWEAVHYSEE